MLPKPKHFELVLGSTSSKAGHVTPSIKGVGSYTQHYLGSTPSKVGRPPNNRHAIEWWAQVFRPKPRCMPNMCLGYYALGVHPTCA